MMEATRTSETIHLPLMVAVLATLSSLKKWAHENDRFICGLLGCDCVVLQVVTNVLYERIVSIFTVGIHLQDYTTLNPTWPSLPSQPQISDVFMPFSLSVPLNVN
jgi:hypothetical protein